nr:1968_t:CDS:2 [Entrophospora candida]
MLIDIIIKTSKNKCSSSAGRMISQGKVTIQEKGGNKINEIMVHGSFNINTSLANEKVNVSSLNEIETEKGPDEEFNLTFQNIYYDPNSKPLSLDRVDLGTNKAVIKNRLADFVNLVEKSNQIKSEIEKFSLDEFIAHLSNFEKYRQDQELYELESFFTQPISSNPFFNDKIFKEIIEKQATKNEFFLTQANAEINSAGLYEDPQYFRGFQPGDLVKGKNPGEILYLSQKAVREKLTKGHVIKPDLALQTKTYFDLLEAKELNEFLEILCSNPTAYSEVLGRDKSQHLKVYQKAIDTAAAALNSDDKKTLDDFCKELSDLFSVLDKNYSTADQTTCRKDLKILAAMDEGLNEWGEKIKNRFGTEITTRKTEIQSRIATFGSSSLSDQIKAAAQAEYGSSKTKVLSPERVPIFTTHAAEITTPELLGKIKDLLDLLIFAEEEKIKLNEIDNQWADHLISQLESRVDSVSALEEADKLLVKVQTAQGKKEADSSLLSELESYSQAPLGDIKNKAYQAVNSFENQVQDALKHLREISKNRTKIIEGIQNAKTESELNAAYQKIKNSDFYQSEKNKKLTDKIHQRKKVCLEISRDSTIPAAINQFLQTTLIKIIPDSIQSKDDEKQLTELENELKTFSQDNQTSVKGKIYHQYKTIFEGILTEISQEKQRWSQINQPNSPQTNSETKGLPL